MCCFQPHLLSVRYHWSESLSPHSIPVHRQPLDIQHTTPDPFERLIDLTDPQFQASARYLISIKTTYRMSGPERNQINQIDQSINLIQAIPRINLRRNASADGRYLPGSFPQRL